MKILTILGTRPEIIRLSRIIPKLDNHCEHIIVHTGQNYDYELDKIFFDSFKIRKPDYYLNARGTFSKQIAIIFEKLETILIKEIDVVLKEKKKKSSKTTNEDEISLKIETF